MSVKKTTSVALFLDASVVGGIEQHVATLAHALLNGSPVYPTIILWKNYHDGSLHRRFRESGARVFYANGQLTKLNKIIDQFGIQVLHTHGYKANIIGRMMGAVKKLQVVSTHHNGDIGSGRLRLYTSLDQWSARFSENWSVSREIQQRLSVASVLMPNFIPMPPNRKFFGNEVAFVGRLQSVKRPDRFLNVARQCPNFSFRIIGDGPLLGNLEQQKTENVVLHGFETNTDLIWNHASVCIICSDVEGLPLVALEAMSRGIPVIAWPLGQLPELIDHEVNGWIVHSEQECAAVVNAWMSKSDVEKERIRLAARQKIDQHYSVRACLPQYLQRYMDLAYQNAG